MKGTWAIVVVIIRDYKKWLNLIVEWRPKLHFCSFTTNKSNPYRAPLLVFFRVFSIVAFDKKDVQENELKTDKKTQFFSREISYWSSIEDWSRVFDC